MVLPSHFVRRVLQLDLGVPHRLQGDLRRLRAHAHAETVRQVRRRRREGRLLNPRRVSGKVGFKRAQNQRTQRKSTRIAQTTVLIYAQFNPCLKLKARRVDSTHH